MIESSESIRAVFATVSEANDLASKLQNLNLEAESAATESEASSAARLDLAKFKTNADLDKLLAFTGYLSQVDSINLAKVMQLFASYSEY